MLGVRLEPELEQRLVAIAKAKHRSKSYIAKEALLKYIEVEEARERRHKETFEAWERFQDTGESYSGEEVMAWLESWGKEDEKECPIQLK